MAAEGNKLNDPWVLSLEKLETTTAPQRKRDLFTIFRVPTHLRKGDESAYEPRIISFGPYHRGKKCLEDMERRKIYYLKKFLRRSPVKTLDYYLKVMGRQEGRARNCYSEEINMTSDQFGAMMLLDGCFIIEFVLMVINGAETSEDDPLDGMIWASHLVFYDMLLLENQIPFFILQDLFNKASIQVIYEKTLVEIVNDFFYTSILSEHTRTPLSSEMGTHHLLHLFHSCVPTSSTKPLKTKRLSKDEESQMTTTSIPSAIKLQEVGIKFKKKAQGGFLDVTFSSGVLAMTTLQIDNPTNSLLRNLVAFEQCHWKSRKAVTSFARFMDCLVDKPADVALLQHEGFLVNGLGSEEATTDLFNQLCEGVIVDLEENYIELFEDVTERCNYKLAQWRATLVRDYFSNPWAFISLMAAIILLVFTVIQAIYAVLSYSQK